MCIKIALVLIAVSGMLFLQNVVINEAFVKCVGNRLHCSFLSISRLSFFFFLYFVCIIVKAIHVRAMSQFFGFSFQIWEMNQR